MTTILTNQTVSLDSEMAGLLRFLEHEGYGPQVETDPRHAEEALITWTDDLNVWVVSRDPREGFTVERFTSNEWDHVWGTPEKAEHGLTGQDVHEVIDGRRHLPYA